MQDRVSRETVQTGEWEVLMIIDYDGRPNATDEERLRSLRDSVQRALNDIDTTILNLQKNGSVDVSELLAAKQDILVSGQNIKTVNNKSLLGSGNINIEGGGGTGGTYDHTELDNRGAANQHPITAIAGLSAALNSKSDEGHTHSQYLTEHQDISGKQDVIGDLDSIRSGAAAGSTALQSEVDPTVPAWAKTPDKPTYTAAEVGALPDDTVIPTVPTNVSAFTNDAGYITQNIKVINADSDDISYAAITSYVDEYDEVLLKKDGRTYRYFGIVNTFHYFTANFADTMYFYQINRFNGSASGSKPIPTASDNYSAISSKAMTGKAVAEALATIDVPTKTSDLENDSGFLTEHQDISGKQDVITDLDTIRSKAENGQVAYEVIENDLSDVAFTGDYNDLVNQPTIPSPTTVEQVLTSGEEIAKVNNVSLFAPQGGGGGITALDVYPVGAIYMSITDTDPSAIFGGEWERIKDTFLLSAGDTYAAGDEGGEATHTLTTTEMPSHNHAPLTTNYKYLTSNANIAVNGTNRNFPSTGSSNHFVYSTATNAEIVEEATTKATGGGGSHNNMPPYLAVYVWKRIA